MTVVKYISEQNTCFVNNFTKGERIMINKRCSAEASLTGKIVSEILFSHKVREKSFFKIYVSVERLSGVKDVIPVIFPEHICSLDILSKAIEEKSDITVLGECRSHTFPTTGKHSVFIYARQILPPVLIKASNNYLEIKGYLCRVGELRTTLSGKTILDVLVAVDKDNNRESYIPCIAWNIKEEEMEQIKVGEFIWMVARMQSRKYIKRYENGECEEKTAYEISIRDYMIVK